ncbi:MAG: alpha/beta hydrolase [Candidatus Binatia bacterium]
MKAGLALKFSIWGAILPSLLWGCFMEERFIFFPDANIDKTPHDIGLAYEDIFFTTRDGLRLNSWFVPYPEAKTTLLWFHGNAGNISNRLDNIKLFHDRLGINIFIFDYRGYGRSEGKVSEKGTYIDGETALKQLRIREDLDTKRIVFFGRSLGAAVATELATREKCLALILESPFVSIREMARVAFPLLPIGRWLRTRYNLIEKIKKVTAPVLVLHGDQDDVVPFKQGRKIFEAAQEPKRFYTIHGAHHNDTYLIGGESYFAVLKDFMARPTARVPHS